MGGINKPTAIQVGVLTGCLGGFTTFSTFSYATLKLIQNGSVIAAITHISVSLIGGLILTYIGYYLSSVMSN